MRYNKIRKMDISNGPGVRISIFLQGCEFKCPHCFNPETHDFNGGKEFNQETVNRLIELANYDHINGLSILGGEPMHPRNRKETIQLAKTFKQAYPHKTVWVWTGFLFDKDLINEEDIEYIDVIVDGLYINSLHDFHLKWKGSSNQRVIDVKETLNTGHIVITQ